MVKKIDNIVEDIDLENQVLVILDEDDFDGIRIYGGLKKQKDGFDIEIHTSSASEYTSDYDFSITIPSKMVGELKKGKALLFEDVNEEMTYAPCVDLVIVEEDSWAERLE